MKPARLFWLILALLSIPHLSISQLSPGDLSASHSHLEGLSNCTKCHTLGEKISNEKCLDCHKLLQQRINEKRGYHYSSEIRGKECITCHSDHHGRNFQMIRFDTAKFDHALTGYKLHGAHDNLKCNDCHNFSFIENDDLRSRKNTFLGLNQACLSCHDDYHQETLSTNCISCHDFKAFRPAPAFDHNETRFKLKGKHQEVDCIECHKKEIVSQKEFQHFAGIAHNNCTSCHDDIHNNKFGQNCESCHTEESFHNIRNVKSFNHDQTGFMLEGKHQFVDCKSCHKHSYTDPIKHDNCTDCHTDYHEKQFEIKGTSPDCSDCHTVQQFSGSTFTIQRHNETSFALKGAHQATPCFICHMKEEKWNFRNIGTSCIDCHPDIHKGYLDEKYYPESLCMNCHNESTWHNISFDHAITRFPLEGAHINAACKRCHNTQTEQGNTHLLFTGLPSNCIDCHPDVHVSQFEKAGITDCSRCHGTHAWTANKFDHNSTRFPLDGKHENVSCSSCHKTITDQSFTYTQYKFQDISCESCH